jgi:predicted dehydrogenase
MVETARAAGIMFGAIFQRRFFPAAQRVKAAIDAGHIGRITTAECIAHLGRDRAYFARAAWRGTWVGEGGGAWMNQAIHMVDLLQWMVGEPRSIQRSASGSRCTACPDIHSVCANGRS